jgi:c-di-GMP-binding flagellar brake protein YcgR
MPQEIPQTMKQSPIKTTEPARGLESELDRFRVRDTTAIQRILSHLARHNRQTIIYFNNGEDFLLSAVVGYDPKTEKLYLDCGTDQNINQRLLCTEKCVAVSAHNQVPVRFSISHLAMEERQGYPAFVVPQPKTLIRVQRREFFRVATPVANPLICHFSAADGSSFEATVLDISLGGMALREHPEIPAETLAIGQQIPSCRIELPGQGLIETGFEVRNVHSNNNRTKKPWVGCRFFRLNARMTTRLQRYIHKLEFEHRRTPESS